MGKQAGLATRLFGRKNRQPKRGRLGNPKGRHTFESLESRLLLASFAPSKDNTLYESATGDVSNGFGPNLFAGRTGEATESLRRGLIQFNLTPLAPGTIVTGARLDLAVTRDPDGANPTHNFTVHRLTQDWGERGSVDPSAGGQGRPAMTGDATWLHTAFSTATWNNPGGDFEPTASATTAVADNGSLASWSSPELAADVQAWINDPATNFGWIIRGEEGTPRSARRFSSRQGIVTPALTVDVAEPGPNVSIAVNMNPIEEDGGQATFTVTMSESSRDDVIVNLGFTGTATLGEDYTASSMRIVIPGGDTQGSMTITALDDLIGEVDETVTVEITTVSGANEAGVQEATTTITDGDGGPGLPSVTLSVDNELIDEAAGAAEFTASLSAPTTTPVTVDLVFSGTATAAADYTASAQQITIAAGASSGSITVTAVQDTLDEEDETVTVDIGSVSGAVEAGTQQQTTTIVDDDELVAFAVEALRPTSSGFVAELTGDLDASGLNLYGLELGDPDVVLSGDVGGTIAGSLVIDPGLRSVTFVKTGDSLPADNYTVRLRSAVDGFKDVDGNLLDGDGDGTAGDDYIGSFAVAAPPADAAILSLPDFVRGAGQEVHLPADSSGGIPLAISISEAATVRSVDVRISYDPGLLDITAATAGANMPAGAFVVLITDTPGLAILSFRSNTTLPVGTNVLVDLQASVPAAAGESYGVQQVLDIHSITVSDGLDTELPAVDDDALHLVSYFADVSGNARINASDASQVARFAALLENGFDAGDQLSDPFIVADISGNGRINAADASLLARFAALLDVPEIPPLPSGLVVSNDPAEVPREELVQLDPRFWEAEDTEASLTSQPGGGPTTEGSDPATFPAQQNFASEDVVLDQHAVDAAITEQLDISEDQQDLLAASDAKRTNNHV